MSEDEISRSGSTTADDAKVGIEFTTPSTDDASGYGLSMTLLGAVLLALSYFLFLAVVEPSLSDEN